MKRILIVIAVLFSGPPVPSARADDQRAEAERYFRTGERLLNAGEFAAAASSFEDAYEILPLPEIAFSAAQSYRLAYVKDAQPGRIKRAVELYRIYLGKVKSGGRVNDATNALLELEPQLARLEAGGKLITATPANRTTGLMITSEVAPASGRIGADPKLAGELPLVREVAAGKHEVTVEAKGYKPKTITAIAVEGELVPVEVDLEPLPAIIAIETEGGARVTVDGRSHGTTPLRAIQVDAGRHYVTITKRGRRSHAREVVLERGATATVATSLRTTTQRRASRWVLIGSGVLLVGSGLAGLGALSADSEASDLDAKRLTGGGITEAELARYDELRAERDDLKTTMWTLGGAALVVGAAGGLMYFLDRDEPEAGPSIAPAIGPDGAGVTVRGSF